jgi:secreted trypsin-like serine protease
MSRPAGLLALSLLAAAGCARFDEPPTSTAVAPIIGGGASPTTDDAVVMLAGYPASRATLVTCSSVLISPTIVLTAAHCVDAPNHPGYLYGIFVGADPSIYDTLVKLEPHLLPVKAVHPYPGYVTTSPFVGDLAVVELAAPLTSVAPAPFARTALPQTLLRQPARIVGYGQTTYGTFNTVRHAATTMVAAFDVGADTVVVGDTTHRGCLGDSGGPAFADVGGVSTVIGIDSYANVGCTDAAHYRRPDMYDAFISMYVPHPAGSPDAGIVDPMPDAGTGGGGGGGGCAVGGSSGLLVAVSLLGLLGLRRRR